MTKTKIKCWDYISDVNSSPKQAFRWIKTNYLFLPDKYLQVDRRLFLKITDKISTRPPFI